jgi:hypothetical protein
MTKENDEMIDALERSKISVVAKGSRYNFSLTVKPKIKWNE